eukprot:3466027-Rhodomonas_salina.1
MAPGYKDHPIPKLKGDPAGDDDETFLCPTVTKAMYDKWLTTVLKVLGALGLFWIIPMALALEFEHGQYSPLIDGVRDDKDDLVFQYIVVALAITAGAQQSLLEPQNALLDLDNCRKNYHYVIQSVPGFSAQLTSKCASSFPNIFGHQEALAALHPLDGLRELADIHSNFQWEGAAVNASTAWQDNFSVMQWDPLEKQSIIDWINAIEKTVQGLRLARVSQEAINGVVCGNVIDSVTSFDDASNPTAARWLTRGDTLCTSNDNVVFKWSELFDTLHSYLTADARKGESTLTEPPVAGRKRKAAAVKPGNTAAVYYTLANLAQAFFMGQQASGGSPPGLPGAQQQGGGSLPMNTHLKCPTCKVNHPGGIHTCPNYAKTKVTIKENHHDQEKFRRMRKKGKGEKKPDKKPDDQLPKGDGVPAFITAEGNTALSKDTQQLGKELFESFSKNPAGIWFAKTAAGVEMEEMSDLPPLLMSSDSE